jgi:hypothetical protein
MLATDALVKAEEQEAAFYGLHARHLWDHRHEAGRMLAKSLQLKTPIAWDVYLLYSPGRRWQPNTPPDPVFWMHQLDDENPSLLLDAGRLNGGVQALTGSL